MAESFEHRLAGEYALLSTKLKQAADFVVSHPVEIATRSLRAVSRDANLAPATFSRMSRAQGYDSYEDLREVMRRSLSRRANTFSDRVKRLQAEHDKGDQDFLTGHVLACTNNLGVLGADMNTQQLEQAVGQLHRARHVLVSGALGSTGIAEHMTYMASFLASNWNMAGRMGASLGSGLVDLDERDVLIVFTTPPFAARSIRAAQAAKAQGAFVIVITDTHSCPALVHASASFIVPTESPHFFSSYAATLVLSETIVGMLAARAGAAARDRIASVEERNRRLEEVWSGGSFTNLSTKGVKDVFQT